MVSRAAGQEWFLDSTMSSAEPGIFSGLFFPFFLTPGCQFCTHFPDVPYRIAGLRERKITAAAHVCVLATCSVACGSHHQKHAELPHKWEGGQ